LASSEGCSLPTGLSPSRRPRPRPRQSRQFLAGARCLAWAHGQHRLMPIRKEHRRAGGAEERAWRRRTSRVLRSGISAATETGIAPDPRLDHKHSRQAPEQLVTRRAAACFQLRRLIAALFVCERLRRRRAASQLPAAAKISNVMEYAAAHRAG
jgi:hypothetical protein